MTLGWISSLNPYRTPDTAHARDERAELVTADGKALPLVSAVLHVDAAGGVARAVLEQEFANESDGVLAVTYKMPLPADGAVSGYEFKVGARTIKGRVDPKAVARERFEAALAQGKTAAILEQEKADIFTQEIGNIPPRTSIKARITVDVRLAWLPEGEWEMRFPTVIGPRYIGSTATDAEVKAASATYTDGPVARVHLEVKVRDRVAPGRHVESPSHALRDRGDGVHELAALSGARLDRDIVLRWAVTRPEVGVSIRAERRNGKAYGLVTIVPPSPEARIGSVPRDLVVLLDTSGSMGGTPLESAKMLIGAMITSLGQGDRLELVEFSDSPRSYRPEPVHASDREKASALAWLRGLRAGGATEMHTAVMQALRSIRPGSQRQVVLVTDGYIGGEEQIVSMLKSRMPEDCRFHFVGVGAAPNRSLATAMARAGRGAEILVAPGEDAERGAARLLAKTNAPVLTDVSVDNAQAATRFLPDVFAGSPVLALVELPESGDVVVRGKLAHGAWQQRVRVPAAEDGEVVPALYAREIVADLEIEAIGSQAYDQQIEQLGVDFQIATRMTSWVAIDETASVDPYAPSRTVEIPQEIPYGTSMASFGFAPSTLTGGGGAGIRAMTMPMSLAAPMAAPSPGTGAPPPAPGGMAMFGAPPPPAQSISRARKEAAPSSMMEMGRAMDRPTGAHSPAPLAPKTRGSRARLFMLFFFVLLFVAFLVWLLTR